MGFIWISLHYEAYVRYKEGLYFPTVNFLFSYEGLLLMVSLAFATLLMKHDVFLTPVASLFQEIPYPALAFITIGNILLSVFIFFTILLPFTVQLNFIEGKVEGMVFLSLVPYLTGIALLLL